jgi:histidinol phosphatase-like enzyme (inositol monophosphatase family)
MTDADLRLACLLADAAGRAIRPYFRAPFAIETKADASPVTQADRAAERAIRDLLAVHAPGDGIVGEEYGRERADADRVWVLDPIDGTRAFIAGRPIFGTLIALLEGGRPVLGILDQPVSGERWIGAAGRPTTLSGTTVTTRACAALGTAMLATTSPWLFDAAGASAFDRLRHQVRDTILGGDCYNYGLLAAGHGDIIVEQGLQLYDFAALVPIVEGAGGLMRDWQGNPLTADSAGTVLAVGDPALLEPALALLE